MDEIKCVICIDAEIGVEQLVEVLSLLRGRKEEKTSVAKRNKAAGNAFEAAKNRAYEKLRQVREQKQLSKTRKKSKRSFKCFTKDQTEKLV